eukprot:RCo033359
MCPFVCGGSLRRGAARWRGRPWDVGGFVPHGAGLGAVRPFEGAILHPQEDHLGRCTALVHDALVPLRSERDFLAVALVDGEGARDASVLRDGGDAGRGEGFGAGPGEVSGEGEGALRVKLCRVFPDQRQLALHDDLEADLDADRDRQILGEGLGVRHTLVVVLVDTGGVGGGPKFMDFFRIPGRCIPSAVEHEVRQHDGNVLRPVKVQSSELSVAAALAPPAHGQEVPRQVLLLATARVADVPRGPASGVADKLDRVHLVAIAAEPDAGDEFQRGVQLEYSLRALLRAVGLGLGRQVGILHLHSGDLPAVEPHPDGSDRVLDVLVGNQVEVIKGGALGLAVGGGRGNLRQRALEGKPHAHEHAVGGVLVLAAVALPKEVCQRAPGGEEAGAGHVGVATVAPNAVHHGGPLAPFQEGKAQADKALVLVLVCVDGADVVPLRDGEDAQVDVPTAQAAHRERAIVRNLDASEAAPVGGALGRAPQANPPNGPHAHVHGVDTALVEVLQSVIPEPKPHGGGGYEVGWGLGSLGF